MVSWFHVETLCVFFLFVFNVTDSCGNEKNVTVLLDGEEANISFVESEGEDVSGLSKQSKKSFLSALGVCSGGSQLPSDCK